MPELSPISLIIPPSLFLLDERVFMTLGVLRVAAVLEKSGYPVEVLDLSGIENFIEAAEYHAQHSRSRIFGLTSTTPQMPASPRIAESIRKVRPEARLILGGPHPTLVNAAYKKEAAAGVAGRATTPFQNLRQLFDGGVAGDGEDAIFHAIKDPAPALVDADDPK